MYINLVLKVFRILMCYSFANFSYVVLGLAGNGLFYFSQIFFFGDKSGRDA